MFFDSAARQNGVEAEAGVIESHQKERSCFFFLSLTKCCSNNIAEYQPLILGLEMTVNIKMPHLKVFRDSQFVIRQLLLLYEVKKP